MSPCARCSRALGASCCEVRPGEQLATLTHADVDRVSAATGLAEHAFAEWEWLSPEQLEAWSRVHPLYVSYLAAQPRRLTLKRTASACVFHQADTGCQLDAAARPTACRLYPFDVRADGSFALSVDRYGSVAQAAEAHAAFEHACLAVEEADSFEALRDSFGLSREAVEALAEQLRAEVAAHVRQERASLHSKRRE